MEALVIVLSIVGVLVLAGVVLAILQATGRLPASWSPERFRAWFDRRRDDE